MIRPGSVTAIPSAIGRAARRVDRLAERAQHRRVPLRLHTDDLDVGPRVLRGDGHARDEAAAADRHDEHLEIGAGGEHLQRDRALTRDDRRVVERGNERRTGAGGELARASVVASVRVAPWRTTWAPRVSVRVIFVNGVTAGHHDRRVDAEQPRVVRDALGVVAGRGGDDALGPLRRVEPEQEVARPAP